MVNVTSEILIRKSKDSVASFAANPDNAPKWYEHITAAEWQTKKKLKTGACFTFKVKMLGVQRTNTWEVVEFIPCQKLVMRTTEGPFEMEMTYGWQAVDENTTCMTVQNRGVLTGFYQLMAPFVAFFIKISNRHHLKHLKQVLETTRQ